MEREELEAELWKLRSVEIDLERAKEEIEELKKSNKTLAEESALFQKDYDQAQKDMQMFKKNIDQAEKERKEALALAEKSKQERDWAIKKLEEYHSADHMYQTYGFKVSDEMPQRQGRNWRLNR